MTPRGRTNQLLYQAELLLAMPEGEDEHVVGRRRASLEGALALTELALDSLLREVTEHANLADQGWRGLLYESSAPLAELSRLRELANDPNSWLAQLLASLSALGGIEGVSPSRQSKAAQTMIASASGPSPEERLAWQLREFKSLLAELRESSAEW